MESSISGIQQIGIGVADVHAAWAWYRQAFGMNIPVFEEAATAGLMLPYTGGQPQDRHAVLALNLQGGGGFEIWQYTSRTPQAPNQPIALGDLGIFACKIKTTDINKAFANLEKQYLISNSIETAPDGSKHFYVRDPYNNVFQIIEHINQYSKTKATTGGVFGAVIGVTDIEKSKAFYTNVLKYDLLAYEGEDVSDLHGVVNNGNTYKRAILRHATNRKGAFSEMLGPSEIELVQTDGDVKKAFDGRYWGDLGYIHLCFDVTDMTAIKQRAESNGRPFTVDSANSFDMGEAAGRFSYIEDPDGTLIEFVETHKIPIAKRWGWYLNLKNRDKNKPLARWMLKSLAINRKK